jgi:hypothetical protein
MSWPILLCVVLMVGFGVAIPWAIRADNSDAHLLHKPGTCVECDQL